tara:strand:- start:1541 stop:2119 length:579 start_codon:yes stop_codon:yes gene_type:complete
MQDIYDIIKNIEGIYESNSSFNILKDFERVLDELDIYVYDNWEDGELAEGPKIDRHWVTCKFFWPRAKMPDPMGGKRLLDYDCKVSYQKTHMIEPRKIRKPDDIRPGTKKGKLDKKAIWIVEIMMPKKLISDMFGSYQEMEDMISDPAQNTNAGAGAGAQPADALAAPEAAPPPPGGAGGEPAPAAPPEGAV